LIGSLNQKYRISGDKDFMLRFANLAPNYLVTNKMFYYYRKHEASKTFSDSLTRKSYWLEDLSILEEWIQSDCSGKKIDQVKKQHRITCWKLLSVTRINDRKLLLTIFVRGLKFSNLQWIVFCFKKIFELVSVSGYA
jgi:hypothetical protein